MARRKFSRVQDRGVKERGVSVGARLGGLELPFPAISDASAAEKKLPLSPLEACSRTTILSNGGARAVPDAPAELLAAEDEARSARVGIGRARYVNKDSRVQTTVEYNLLGSPVTPSLPNDDGISARCVNGFRSKTERGAKRGRREPADQLQTWTRRYTQP